MPLLLTIMTVSCKSCYCYRLLSYENTASLPQSYKCVIKDTIGIITPISKNNDTIVVFCFAKLQKYFGIINSVQYKKDCEIDIMKNEVFYYSNNKCIFRKALWKK